MPFCSWFNFLPLLLFLYCAFLPLDQKQLSPSALPALSLCWEGTWPGASLCPIQAGGSKGCFHVPSALQGGRHSNFGTGVPDWWDPLSPGCNWGCRAAVCWCPALLRPPCGALQSPWGRVMGQVGLRGAIGSGCSALSQQCSEPGAGKSSFPRHLACISAELFAFHQGSASLSLPHGQGNRGTGWGGSPARFVLCCSALRWWAWD